VRISAQGKSGETTVKPESLVYSRDSRNYYVVDGSEDFTVFANRRRNEREDDEDDYNRAPDEGDHWKPQKSSRNRSQGSTQVVSLKSQAARDLENVMKMAQSKDPTWADCYDPSEDADFDSDLTDDEYTYYQESKPIDTANFKLPPISPEPKTGNDTRASVTPISIPAPPEMAQPTALLQPRVKSLKDLAVQSVKADIATLRNQMSHMENSPHPYMRPQVEKLELDVKMLTTGQQTLLKELRSLGKQPAEPGIELKSEIALLSQKLENLLSENFTLRESVVQLESRLRSPKATPSQKSNGKKQKTSSKSKAKSDGQKPPSPAKGSQSQSTSPSEKQQNGLSTMTRRQLIALLSSTGSTSSSANN
jgi:regulator of replication initiation timing